MLTRAIKEIVCSCGNEFHVRETSKGKFFVVSLPLAKIKKDSEINIETLREELLSEALEDL